MYIILNNEIKKDSPEDSTLYPNNLEIDYIQVYQPKVSTTISLTNGNFETGSVDPWMKYGTSSVSSKNQRSGSYCAYIGADNSDGKICERYGTSLWVYNDPGTPCFLEEDGMNGSSEDYRWTFELVSVWSSHLNPYDGVMWDISPGAIGNIQSYPVNYAEYDQFYDVENGGEKPGIADGYDINPVTGESYEPQIVPRGDYARVLAEFWADGPNSETPPGHWFTILNYVNDHPLHEHRFMGEGDLIDNLEWDVKSYFILGGAMHDVAISSWSIKGYYDYVRPISAIRSMATRGQSSDSELPNYDPQGIGLIDGLIELITEGDSLAGENGENIGKIKVYARRGHDFVSDAETDEAGVGWILGENWWPYQRPSFVTPPFAGYISGHSTYSSAAAKILTMLTGSEYFPGGMGEFHAPKNNFLVFEKSPSVNVTLQWAKYYDASDQCSLSRIWGGIHPPMDDIRGRVLGRKLGAQAFEFALKYFENEIVLSATEPSRVTDPYPNPVHRGQILNISTKTPIVNLKIFSLDGKQLNVEVIEIHGEDRQKATIRTSEFRPGVYLVRIRTEFGVDAKRILVLN